MEIAWVTGAQGFIGQHLVRHLVNRDFTVSGIGHGATPPTVVKQQGLSHWINGDIDAHNLQQLLQSAGSPDVIYHLAGGSSVGLSLQTPSEDFRRSVISTSALLEWSRMYLPNVSIVISSSAAVYGDTKESPIPEDGVYTPYSPYGFHKRAAELLCESYAQSFGMRIAIVRLFSVYGPGLRKQLLWDLCDRLQQSPELLQLFGTGDELRDWLYIDDAVEFLIQSNYASSSEPFIINGASGKGTSVKDVTTLLCQIWGANARVSFSGEVHAGNPFSLVANVSKAKSIGVKTQCSLRLGLEQYINWFRYHQNHTS